MNCRDITREELGLPWFIDSGSWVLRNNEGCIIAMLHPDAIGDMEFALSLVNNFKYKNPEKDKEGKEKHLAIAARQYREISDTGVVTCTCGVTAKVYAQIYKCFFCGIFLCKKCMEEHIK